MNVIKRRSGLFLALILAAAVLIAATWYGTWDVTFDPRNRANEEDARSFIRATVNESVAIWRPGDSVTLCRGSSCALYVYFPNGTWAFARAIDSRSRPPESWIEKLIRWLLGEGPDPGSLYDTFADGNDSVWTECLGVGSGVRVTYYVEGFWRHGYVNGQYAGSVFVGTTVTQYETVGAPQVCS